MSKKHKKNNFITSEPQAAGFSHEAEYKIIKHDLIRVIILNAVYLAAILALYFGNLRSGFLDVWFAKIFHF